MEISYCKNQRTVIDLASEIVGETQALSNSKQLLLLLLLCDYLVASIKKHTPKSIDQI